MGLIALADEEEVKKEEDKKENVIHIFHRPYAWITKGPEGLLLIQHCEDDIKLLHQPIECTAIVLDDENIVCGRMLSFFSDLQKRRIEVFCDDSTMGRTDAFERFLIRHGVKIATEEQILGRRTCASLLRSYLLFCEPELRILRRSVSGWVPSRDGFLLGTEAIGPNESEELPQPSRKYISEFDDGRRTLKTHGTIDEWVKHCALPVVDSPMWVTAILASFAAPLLTLLGLEDCSGGFHFWGHSSTGKTIGLKLAAGIYGQELMPWRLTGNGLEGIAAQHSDRILVLDEIMQANPKDVMSAIYMLSNRQGKVRMTDKIKIRKTLSWQLLFLSSGEISIEDIATKAKTEYYEGQALRFLSIPMIPKKYSPKFVQELEKSIRCLHGTVGRAWLNFLMNSDCKTISDWRKQYEELVQEYISTWKSEDPRINRILQRLAILELAANLAHTRGFLPDEFFPRDSDDDPEASIITSVVRDSLLAILKSWGDGQGVNSSGGTLSDTKKAAKRLLESVHVAIANRWLVPFDGTEFSQPPGSKTVGFIDETNPEDKTVFLLESVLKKTCLPPGIRTFTKELADENILIRDERNKDKNGKGRLKTRMKAITSTLLVTSDYRIDRSVQAYAFNMNLLEEYTNS